MERLLTEGEFPHILLRICRELSATELACLECVSRAWRRFIQQNIWGSDLIARQELGITNTFEIIDFLLKGNKICVGFLHANN